MAGLFRLSRKFHETIGEDLAGEIEAGFERVDTINNLALRELFETKLDQRLSEFRVLFESKLDQRFAEFRGEIDRRFAELKGELKQDISDLRVALASTESRLVRWIFLF